MKKAIGDAKNILKGVSTLDIMNANLRMILLLLMMTAVLSGAIYGRLGHSILDLVDPSFNPQVSTSSFTNKSVFAVAALPNGKILVSGQFNSYNRQPVGGLYPA